MKLKSLLFILLFCWVGSDLIAQQSEGVYTLSTLSVEQKTKSTGTSSYYTLNSELLEQDILERGDVISFQTLNGERLLRITRVSRYMPGTISYRAVSDPDADQEVFSFTYADGKLVGLYHGVDRGTLHFDFDAKAKQNRMHNEHIDELNCDHELVAVDTEELSARKAKANETVPVTNLYSDLEEETTIDVLITYTDRAEDWAIENGFGLNGMSEVISQAMNLSQSALDNTGIPITLRVVYTHKLNYDEGFSGTNSGEILRQLTASPSFNPFGIQDGEMDEVHTLRDEYGADFVTIFARVDDTGGLAWRLNNVNGSPNYGFSLNRVQQVTTGYTVVHELGHNMGNSHSRTQVTQSASVQGGVFQESVGYQDPADSVHTVMAYNSYAGSIPLTRIPVFSNPDLEWQGTTAGLNLPSDITNAALSMKKIKGTIASYRLTKLDPPFAEFNYGPITVNMNREEFATVNFPIENTGDSNLEYNLDFTSTEGVIFKRKGVNPSSLFALNDTLYYADFESSEDYTASLKFAANSWRIYGGDSATRFRISNTSPSTGTQNLRLEYDESGGSHFLYSPFLGNLAYGTYRTSMDVSIANVAGVESEQFDLIYYDGRTGDASAGFIINNGAIFVRTIDELGNGSFISSGVVPTPGTYQKLEVEFDAQTEEVNYYIDSVLVHQFGFQTEGNTPSEMIVAFTNTVTDSYIDIDDFTITRKTNPYVWLKLGSRSGTIAPGATQVAKLDFSTKGVPAGVYHANMIYRSNEDILPEYQIPVTLDVANVVSNEEEADNIMTFQLEQNYPNPFNPSTSIRFNLPEAGIVSLKVFNVLGQEVSTLINERMTAGEHAIQFNGAELSSGLYLYKLKMGDAELTRKMMLIK